MTATYALVMELYEGKAVISSDDQRLGVVSQTYKDAITGKTAWLLIGAGPGQAQDLLVPSADMEEDESALHVPYTAEVVREQPVMEGEGSIAREALSNLAAYFGLPSENDDDWNR